MNTRRSAALGRARTAPFDLGAGLANQSTLYTDLWTECLNFSTLLFEILYTARRVCTLETCTRCARARTQACLPTKYLLIENSCACEESE
ncbi:hypothetical protein EVAR_2803_1 [Eumeta japonica]|uniref:Uncharacterized protein n=1 Tax=Eumeta variegata TaxID=151549 RepID=A0A4C1SZK1_EUMVA|nr:hypothetical protein EVAR_2803_1 [Eumeta japonica]